MTLESRVNKHRYIGNGSTKTFNFSFRVWKTNQVLVYLGDGKTEHEVSSQCAISLTSTGGTVTFNEAPVSGKIIVIRRNMPYIQEDDYRNGTRFDSEEVEDRFDQDCAERQDLKLGVDRSIKVAETSDKTPEQYEHEYWSAHDDVLQAKDNIEAMLRELGTDVGTHTYVVANGTTHARTLGDRFADYINVKDFGAKGDGVTIDTQAFQAALNRQAQTGAAIFVPTGTYLCGSLYYKGRIRIFGNGAGYDPYNVLEETSSIIVFTGSSGVLFSPSNDAYSTRGSIFSGIALKGTAGIGFKGKTTVSNRNISFKNCCFEGFAVGVQLSDAFNNIVDGCVFNNCGKGIYYTSVNFGETSSVTGDLIKSCYFSSCLESGVYCVGLNSILFLEDIFEYNNNGVVADDSYRATFINCYFEGNTTSGITMPRGIAILCFAHKTLGNNSINFVSGSVYSSFGFISNFSSNKVIATDVVNGSVCTFVYRPIFKSLIQIQSLDGEHVIGIDGSTDGDRLKISIDTTDSFQFSNNGFKPLVDDTFMLGDAGLRFTDLFLGTGTVHGSDKRLKENIKSIDDKILDAWSDVCFVLYQFKNAISKKGDKARLHTGVVAQDLIDIFDKNKIDISKYGFFCFDKWDDVYENIEVIDKEPTYNSNGDVVEPAVTHVEKRKTLDGGDRYSIRYTEVLIIEAAYQRRRADRLEARLAELEERVNQLTNNTNN